MLEVRPFSQRDRRFQELARRRALSDPDLERQAAEIILRVGKLGDAGLVDAGSAGPLVPETELMAAREVVSEQFLTALSLARVNLRKFHECQRRTGYLHDDGDGVRLSRLARPLSRIGICCGHSFAALLQHAVPAQMAGVGRIAVAAAPGPGGAVDPHVLAAARILGLDEVYRMTGAAAVAAFAQGTESVAPVDK